MYLTENLQEKWQNSIEHPIFQRLKMHTRDLYQLLFLKTKRNS